MCPDNNAFPVKPRGHLAFTKVVEGVALKHCGRCGSWLPRDDCFGLRPPDVQGVRYPRPWCIFCSRVYNTQWRAKQKK